MTTALIACSLPLGISRTAVICILVGLAVWSVFLPASSRLSLAAAVLAATAAAAMALPSYVSSLAQSFQGAGTDNSVAGRLDDYPIVLDSVREHPLFGQPLPLRGLILDNQWLATLVDGGLFAAGTFAIVAVVTPLYLGSRVLGRRDIAAGRRAYVGALVAGSLTVAVGALSFDLLSFPQSTFLLFAFLGALFGSSAQANSTASRSVGGRQLGSGET
ncbi:O-antigen ligase family protein [Blastococcus goldschmidtiae]|uniref:O-antigen ligase family protein n=1 Tax=Blastococcus goldschmidtiae TaxID=3075546 RepID=A0ABU2KAZ1_9ACTN|nr:O-antigen ligase family protein [Blastococcus sp. DSM 46792]MDT0277347.1 O-antigen ligase family protein [Blastococcus sp. DSM 46792]